MLPCQDFRRSHQAALVIVVEGNEHGHQRDQCLSTAYIPLKQPIHLVSRAKIGPDLSDPPFLGIGQFKGEVVMVELVDIISDL